MVRLTEAGSLALHKYKKQFTFQYGQINRKAINFIIIVIINLHSNMVRLTGVGPWKSMEQCVIYIPIWLD